MTLQEKNLSGFGFFIRKRVLGKIEKKMCFEIKIEAVALPYSKSFFLFQ